MNIFVLDKSPLYAAEYHCDSHVVKMVLETAQIMSAVHHRHPADGDYYRYKPTHLNHPCTKWAMQSLDNYMWLRDLGIYLGREFTYRYYNVHKSAKVLEALPPPDLESSGFTPFAQAMPDKYKHDDPVQAYRQYYLGAKRHLLRYSRRGKPDWLVQMINEEVADAC